MSCKDKSGNNKNKAKTIICEACKCTYDENNKLKVICTDCENQENLTIICNVCNCIYDEVNDKKQVCLKECNCNGDIEDTIYITCTEYKEDLD